MQGLSAAHARLAVDRIRKLAVAERRPLTAHEAKAVVALATIALAPKRKARQRARAVRATAPLPFPKGTPVAFQTAGRGGTSYVRTGTVTGARSGSRGTWVEIAEDGAAEGIMVHTRMSLVWPISQSEPPASIRA